MYYISNTIRPTIRWQATVRQLGLGTWLQRVSSSWRHYSAAGIRNPLLPPPAHGQSLRLPPPPPPPGVGELINPFIRDEVVTPADRFAFGNRSGRDGVPPGNAMRDRRSRRRWQAASLLEHARRPDDRLAGRDSSDNSPHSGCHHPAQCSIPRVDVIDETGKMLLIDGSPNVPISSQKYEISIKSKVRFQLLRHVLLVTISTEEIFA